MKLLFLTACISFCFSSLSQDGLNLEVEDLYDNNIIIPTWNNLSNLLFCDNKDFSATMEKYDYSAIQNDGSYIANTRVGSPYFTIKKGGSDIVIIFTKDMGYASKFRRELKSKINNVQPKYDGDTEYYYVTTEVKGSRHDLKIVIRENSGRSTCGIVLL